MVWNDQLEEQEHEIQRHTAIYTFEPQYPECYLQRLAEESSIAQRDETR